MSHAPAPWKTGPINYADVYDADGDVIALIPKGYGWTIDTARLIAAAPELLEQLKSVLSCIELVGETLGDMDAMRTAIAKAEGE